jgi:hypothetical protein
LIVRGARYLGYDNLLLAARHGIFKNEIREGAANINPYSDHRPFLQKAAEIRFVERT